LLQYLYDVDQSVFIALANPHMILWSWKIFPKNSGKTLIWLKQMCRTTKNSYKTCLLQVCNTSVSCGIDRWFEICACFSNRPVKSVVYEGKWFWFKLQFEKFLFRKRPFCYNTCMTSTQAFLWHWWIRTWFCGRESCFQRTVVKR
jgi:hypothetical protein